MIIDLTEEEIEFLSALLPRSQLALNPKRHPRIFELQDSILEKIDD